MAKGGNGALVVGGLGLLALVAFGMSGTAKAAIGPTTPAKPPAKPPGGGGGGGPAAPVTVAGCTVDAGYPFGDASRGALSQVALNDLLTNPGLDVITLQTQAQAQIGLGFPKVAACILARSLVQTSQGPQGAGAPIIGGCQVDANFPLNMQYVLQDLLTNPNYTSAFLSSQASQYTTKYPLVSACLSAAANDGRA